MTQHETFKKKAAQTALWKRGTLDFLFDTTQLEMKQAFDKSESKKFLFLCARRLGKSYLCCGISAEAATRKKTKIIYLTSTFKAVREIVKPIFDKLFESCPAALRPKYKTQEGKYLFPNGSEILLFGSDRNPDSARGQEADLIVIDEAGFVENLSYMVSSVFVPMTMMTNGRILMATTPPKSTDHDFIGYLAEARATNSYVKKTIYDCPRVTPKMIQEYMDECGGENSNEWRREYLCEEIMDEERTVIPEWTQEKQALLIRDIPREPWADKYVGMDLGFVDDTALVFCWYDFLGARLVVEDELIIRKQNTQDIAAAIRTKERELWPDADIYKRVADTNNPQLIYDLASLHRLPFIPADKSYSKDSGINKLRLMIARNQIIVHPRCTNLIAQLQYCRWKGHEKVTFDRSERFGHFDLVDALIMAANNLNISRNPVPTTVDVHAQYIPPTPKSTDHPLSKLVPSKFRTQPKINKFTRYR